MDLRMQGTSDNKYRMDQFLYGTSFSAGLNFFSYYDKLEFIAEVKFSWSYLNRTKTYTTLINGFNPAYVTRDDFISLPSISLPLGFKYNIGNPHSTPTVGGGVFLAKFINPEIYMDGSLAWPSNQTNFAKRYEFNTEQLPNSGMWFSIGYLLSKDLGNRISLDLRFEQYFPVGQVEKMHSYVLLVGWYF